MMSAIFTFNLLLIGCLTLLTFMFVPDVCYVSENIVKMRMRSRRDIVHLGNVSRQFCRHADGKKVIVVNLGYFSE